MTKRGSATEVDMTAALEEARAAIGTPRQVERLRSKLAAGVAAAVAMDTVQNETTSAVRAADGPAATHAPTALPVSKFTLLAAAIGIVGATTWFATRSDANRPPPSNRTHARTSAAQTSARDQTAEPSPEATRPRPSMGSAGPSASATGAANDENALVPASPLAAAGRKVGRTSAPAAVSHARGTSPAPASVRVQPSEVELLTRAQSLIDAQPSAALAALHEHELAYPSGLLREERDVLRIDAEWALGRRATALAHARSFVARYPRSTQTRRFEALLSDHKTEADSTPTE